MLGSIYETSSEKFRLAYPGVVPFALGVQRIAVQSSHVHVAVGQNQWYHVGVGAPPILVYFSGDWDQNRK